MFDISPLLQNASPLQAAVWIITLLAGSGGIMYWYDRWQNRRRLGVRLTKIGSSTSSLGNFNLEVTNLASQPTALMPTVEVIGYSPSPVRAARTGLVKHRCTFFITNDASTRSLPSLVPQSFTVHWTAASGNGRFAALSGNSSQLTRLQLPRYFLRTYLGHSRCFFSEAHVYSETEIVLLSSSKYYLRLYSRRILGLYLFFKARRACQSFRTQSLLNVALEVDNLLGESEAGERYLAIGAAIAYCDSSELFNDYQKSQHAKDHNYQVGKALGIGYSGRISEAIDLLEPLSMGQADPGTYIRIFRNLLYSITQQSTDADGAPTKAFYARTLEGTAAAKFSMEKVTDVLRKCEVFRSQWPPELEDIGDQQTSPILVRLLVQGASSLQSLPALGIVLPWLAILIRSGSREGAVGPSLLF